VEFQRRRQHREGLGLRLVVGGHAGLDVAGGDPAVLPVDGLDTFLGLVGRLGTCHLAFGLVGFADGGSSGAGKT
jgi:hypothetical protein